MWRGHSLPAASRLIGTLLAATGSAPGSCGNRRKQEGTPVSERRPPAVSGRFAGGTPAPEFRPASGPLSTNPSEAVGKLTWSVLPHGNSGAQTCFEGACSWRAGVPSESSHSARAGVRNMTEPDFPAGPAGIDTGATSDGPVEATFSLETIYATGARYQPLIRALEATGKAGLQHQLNQQEKNALMQNIRDVLTHSYQEAANGRSLGVTALARQAQLGRWQYLNQLPAPAQRALRSALAEFNISISAENARRRD